jgi:hypothetical protein
LQRRLWSGEGCVCGGNRGGGDAGPAGGGVGWEVEGAVEVTTRARAYQHMHARTPSEER